MTPTIDTLINTIILFSTVELGAFTFIGGLLIAKGIAQDQRAEKAIEKIEKTKEHIEAIEKNVLAIFNQAQAALTKISEREQGLQKVTTDLEGRLEQVDIKDKKVTALLSNLEQRTTAYSNTLHGSANILNSDNVVSSSQQSASARPTYPLIYPGIYGNPINQAPDLLTQVVTQQNPFIVTDAGEVNLQNQNPLMDYLMSDAVPVVKSNPTPPSPLPAYPQADVL